MMYLQQLTDHELVEQLNSGKREAFEAIYAKYAKSMPSLCVQTG